MERKSFGILQLVLAQFLIGFIYILVKLGDSFGTYNLVFFRVFLTFIFIGFLFILSKKYKFVGLKKERWKMILFGFLHGLTILLSFISIKYLTVSLAVLLTATISIWMTIFSHFLLKEKINFKIWLAILASFVGIIFIVKPFYFNISGYPLGIITGLLVGLLGGFIYTLSKTFKGYNWISLTFWQNLIATPFLIPLLFIHIPIFTTYNSSIVILLGIAGALSFILLYNGFKLIKGQVGAVLTLLNILFTVLFGVLFFRDMFSLTDIIGGILIVCGSYLAIRSQ